MPIYNAGHFLRLAVKSILNQTYTNWELFIIDDGSTDSALETISDITDPRIHIIKDGRNLGLAMRLNQAIDLSRGKYFARMDQDDVSFPERFEKQVQHLESSPSIDLVSCSVIAISENNTILGKVPCLTEHKELCSTPWKGLAIPHPTWMGKCEWFRKHKYKIPGPYFCEDQELLLRTFQHSQFSAVPDYVFAYRIRDKRNLARVLKTRWVLLRIQSHFFINQRKINHLILAWLYCATLAIRDLWWHASNASSISIKRHADKNDETISKTWEKLMVSQED